MTRVGLITFAHARFGCGFGPEQKGHRSGEYYLVVTDFASSVSIPLSERSGAFEVEFQTP